MGRTRNETQEEKHLKLFRILSIMYQVFSPATCLSWTTMLVIKWLQFPARTVTAQGFPQPIYRAAPGSKQALSFRGGGYALPGNAVREAAVST